MRQEERPAKREILSYEPANTLPSNFVSHKKGTLSLATFDWPKSVTVDTRKEEQLRASLLNSFA